MTFEQWCSMKRTLIAVALGLFDGAILAVATDAPGWACMMSALVVTAILGGPLPADKDTGAP